ncbi:MAG: acyl-CoA thioesterase, partial [Bacteroidota bacterium]
MPQPEFRTVAYSQTTLTELMIPSYSNFGGKIHGGIVLGLMDKVAYACAAKHAGGYCVTVSVENVNFRAPIDVGDLVSLLASVNYVGNSSMIVGIRVVAENVA